MSLTLGVPIHEILQWPAWEIATYQEYDSIQPFGDMRHNWHSAVIAYILAKAHSDPKKSQPEFRDFLWKDEKQRQQESTQHVLNMLAALKAKK